MAAGYIWERMESTVARLGGGALHSWFERILFKRDVEMFVLALRLERRQFDFFRHDAAADSHEHKAFGPRLGRGTVGFPFELTQDRGENWQTRAQRETFNEISA